MKFSAFTLEVLGFFGRQNILIFTVFLMFVLTSSADYQLQARTALQMKL
jgi:hypothetical protein